MENQKKVLYITIGLMGVGKTTWAKGHCEGTGGLHLSSDGIRMQLYGTLKGQTTPVQNKEVFRLMQEGLDSFSNNDSLTTAYYDATNLNRKKRIQVYTWAKARGITVIAKVFLKPLQDLLDCNDSRDEGEQVPVDIIRERYKDLQVPRLGVDCDEVQVEGVMSDFHYEIYEGLSENHDSPHHAESIKEHILLTLLGCQEFEEQPYYTQLLDVAGHHDLGKAVCRTEDTEDLPHKNYFREQNNGLYCTYMGHAEVSACYYLANMNEAGVLDSPEAHRSLEAIYQHMNAHQGLSQKVINRNKLTAEDLELINLFKGIDRKGKRVNTDVYAEFNRIKDEYMAAKATTK